MTGTLVRLDIRCKQHRDFSSDCPTCTFVRNFETAFQMLQQRRRELIRQLCKKLRSGDVVPVEIL
jgi:hypothetical protein